MKRITLTGAMLLLACFFAVSFTLLQPNDDRFVVVIDAGHGGEDAGAVIGELKEKAIALEIAQKVQKIAANLDLEIILTRHSDVKLPLEKRVEIAAMQRADLMVSLHFNQHEDDTRSGVEVYYNVDNAYAPQSRTFCRTFLENFEKMSPQMEIVGIRNAGFMVLKNAPCPSVLLELGFLTNFSDHAHLSDELYRDRLARTVVMAVSDYQKKR